MNCWPDRSLAPRCLLALALAALPAVAAAQVAPKLGYVYPPVVKLGQATQVALGGYDFTSDMQFFVHHEQVRLETDGQPGEHLVPPPPYWFGEKGRLKAFPIPREVPATLHVGETQTGFAYWQVANANGSSATAPIYLSDQRELLEDRWRDAAQTLPPLAAGERFGLSGRLLRIAEVDKYVLRVTEPTAVTVDLMARRLGADFHGVLQVTDGEGRVIADVADTVGADTLVTFRALPQVDYEVRLHDVDFRGNRSFVYRLEVAAEPHISATIPATLAAGESREIRLISPLFPPFTDHVTIPVSAAGAASWSCQVETPAGPADVTIPLAAAPELPGDIDPASLQAPFALTVDLSSASPHDAVSRTYQVSLPAGVWTIAARSFAIGGALDMSLEVLDADGKRVAQNDDTPQSPDAAVTVRAAKPTTYTVTASDLSGNGGRDDALFQLQASQANGFTLTAPQQLTGAIGAAAALKVTAERHGYDGEIQLHVEGLPTGVLPPESLVIPAKKGNATISFSIAEDAAATAAVIRVTGEATDAPMDASKDESKGASKDGAKDASEHKTNSETLPEPVVLTAPAAGSVAAHQRQVVPLDALLLTATMKPRYQVKLVDKNRQRAVHRGTTYPAPFVIEREEGFAGDVQLQMASQQGRHRQGIDGPIVTVPAKQREVFYPCFMPQWLETDRTTRMVVLGVAGQRDPRGNLRQVTQTADARITMILEGALLQIGVVSEDDRGEHVVRAGEEHELRLRVSRSRKLPLPVRVELVPPAEIASWVGAAPLALPTGADEGVLRLQTQDAPRIHGAWPLTVKATAMQDGRWVVVAQQTFVVRFH